VLWLLLASGVTAMQRNISLPSLQRVLGHDHLRTSQFYLSLSPEEVIREFGEKW
jgi:site-specific recombinase XerD